MTFKTEIKKEEQPIRKLDNQNKFIKIRESCANEEKKLRGILNNFTPEILNAYYEAEKNYINCMQAAKISLH